MVMRKGECPGLGPGLREPGIVESRPDGEGWLPVAGAGAGAGVGAGPAAVSAPVEAKGRKIRMPVPWLAGGTRPISGDTSPATGVVGAEPSCPPVGVWKAVVPSSRASSPAKASQNERRGFLCIVLIIFEPPGSVSELIIEVNLRTRHLPRLRGASGPSARAAVASQGRGPAFPSPNGRGQGEGQCRRIRVIGELLHPGYPSRPHPSPGNDSHPSVVLQISVAPHPPLCTPLRSACCDPVGRG